MEKHINTVEIRVEGEWVTHTKTSTHRDYQYASITQYANGAQALMVCHLPRDAGEKFPRSTAAAKTAEYNAQGREITAITLVPVKNEVVRTGKDAEAAKPAKEATEARVDGNDTGSCHCGCGEQVTGKTLYRPGHDARHVSNFRKAIQATDAQGAASMMKVAQDLLSPKLLAKLVRQLGK